MRAGQRQTLKLYDKVPNENASMEQGWDLKSPARSTKSYSFRENSRAKFRYGSPRKRGQDNGKPWSVPKVLQSRQELRGSLLMGARVTSGPIASQRKMNKALKRKSREDCFNTFNATKM